jgi:hypothetical protein
MKIIKTHVLYFIKQSLFLHHIYRSFMHKIKFFSLVFLIIVIPLHAEILHSETWNYTIDLPEGFELEANNGADTYQFKHSFMPVTTIIKTYKPQRYTSSTDALQNSLSQLNATITNPIDSAIWQNADNAIASFSMQINENAYTGWAFTCSLPEKKGTVLLLSYADENKANECQQFLLSIVDSFSISNTPLNSTGPITSYAFPETEDISYTLNIANKDISVKLDKEAATANKFVIEREYAVLTLYANSPLWKEAWQRYYRMIYRDSYQRLQKTAFTLYNQLYPIAKAKNPENANRELAQILLTWTQGFDYEREKTASDFANLPSIITGEGSDCDSRSMLLAVLLAQMHCKTMMFVSAEYSHAIFGIAVEGEQGKNAHIEVDNTSYLLGETTAKIDIGMIAADLSDSSKWIPILGI